MFIAALFTIAKIWKQSKCPSINEWIKKWYIYIMKYDSAIRRNTILTSATTWKNLGVMLIEVSQTKKDKRQMILLICGI